MSYVTNVGIKLPVTITSTNYANTRVVAGKYGACKYGRAKYAVRHARYGEDKYGRANYA